MSTNGVNVTGDADMAECEEEKVVTMMDVLQEQQEFEEDANAVLGASDDKDCTYSKGYIKRQAIYACLTCCVEAKIDPTKRAGVCLACSLNCHENHELIELYTKRNFRCDCGNPKFNGHPCQFVQDKVDINEENNYNQNFSGLYCTCHRPYPDPEAPFEDEMIQCIVCEDWLHASHLETSLPTSEYAEMICKACMEKNEFLHDYIDLAVNTETDDVDVINNTDMSVGNNTSEFNGDVEKVSEAMKESDENKEDSAITNIAIDKVESVLTENDTGYSKSEELAHSTADKRLDKTTPEQADGSEKCDIDVANTNESSSCVIDQLPETDNKSENKEAISNTNNDSSNLTEADNGKNISVENEIQTDKPNDDNSIIERIEKIENELGDKNNTSENDDLKAKTEGEDKCNENNIQESLSGPDLVKKTENAVATSVTAAELLSSDKKEDMGSITNDVEMNQSSNSDKEVNNSEETVENSPRAHMCSVFNNSHDQIGENTKDIKRKLSTEDAKDVTPKKPKLDKDCTRPNVMKRKLKGATFWPSCFRQKLCTCHECISMYKDLSVLYLTDPDDTVTAYETLGKEKIDGTATSQYERGLEALSSLDRIQQINALTEYNKMRDKLLDYLKSFKDRKEIVKEEDIKAFFAGMKPKRESDGVYFCR